MTHPSPTIGMDIRAQCNRLFARLAQVDELVAQHALELCRIHNAHLPLPTVSWTAFALLVQSASTAEQSVEHVVAPVSDASGCLWQPSPDGARRIDAWPSTVEVLRIRRFDMAAQRAAFRIAIESERLEAFGRERLVNTLHGQHPRTAAARLAWFARGGYPVEPACEDLVAAELLQSVSIDGIGAYQLSTFLLDQIAFVERFFSAWLERGALERLQLAALIGDWPAAENFALRFCPQRYELCHSLYEHRVACCRQLDLRRDGYGHPRATRANPCTTAGNQPVSR